MILLEHSLVATFKESLLWSLYNL